MMKLSISTCLVGALTLGAAHADPTYQIKPDVVYGHKMGMALTFDVVVPKEKANGAGVLFMVSGGWVSSYIPPEKALSGDFNNALGFTKLLDKGFAVFLVRHGSSPRFRVPDAVDDVRKATRYIHKNAADFGVDPQRLGVFGASAGGHLSLMLGTTGDDGDAKAAEPLAQAGNRVAAVVAIFPPSELKSYHESEKMRKDFPALTFDGARVDDMSPIKQVTADDAPTLLLHGGKDTLVPDKHSREIHQAFQEKKVPTDLIIFPTAGHAFTGADREQSVSATVAWFEKYLAKAKDFDLAGHWKSSATLDSGEVHHSEMVFTAGNPSWTGKSIREDGTERAFESVQLAGKSLTLEVKIGGDGQERLVRVTGEAKEPNKIVGKWALLTSSGDEETTGAWEAVREESKEVVKAASTNPLAGEWDMEMSYGDGDPRDYVLKIAEEASALKGTFVSPRSGDYPLESVKLADDQATFRVKRDFNGTEATLVFTGKLEKGAISGKVQIEGQESLGEGKWTAKRK